MNKKRAFTLIELLVVISIIGLLMAILLPALAGAQRNARKETDKNLLRQVQMGWTGFAGSNKGSYPIPSLIDRQPINVGDGAGLKEVNGRGAPTNTFNHTAAVYSVSIMNNLFTPNELISPADPGDVFVYQTYDYTALNANPAVGQDDIHWDPNLVIDYDPEEGLSHASYQCMPLVGSRVDKEWSARSKSRGADFAITGTRGPQQNGALHTPGLANNAYGFYGDETEWEGLVGYNDGSVRDHDSFYPSHMPSLGAGPGGDAVLDSLFWYECSNDDSVGGICYASTAGDSMLCSMKFNSELNDGSGGLADLADYDFRKAIKDPDGQWGLGNNDFDGLLTWDEDYE